jgi:hypothetical protein
MRYAKAAIGFCLILFFINNNYGQNVEPEESDDSRKRRIGAAVATLVTLDIAALAILSEAWYKHQPRTSFHFFNDYPEWKQADKAGHILCSYYLSRAAIETLKAWDVPERKAFFWGSLTGFLLISQVELLDGFSSEYGASLSDLAANSIGSLLAYSQYALWNEPRVHLKYSFHRSGYASQRPEVLGSNIVEEMLKDYNGQTFWLSIDVEKFLPEGNSFPKWLNVGLGYSVENIVWARDRINPYRQYFLSLDLDLTNIKTNSKLVKYLLYGINMIHLPSPALEMNKNRMKFHWFYF